MGLSYTFIFHTNHGSFHTIGSTVSYCMRYPIIQWHCMFILSAGIVHTNTPDDFIPARVMFHTSYVCATTQPSTPYSLYSAPDARDVLCTTRSPFGERSTGDVCTQTAPEIMHTLHPTHLPQPSSFLEGKKTTPAPPHPSEPSSFLEDENTHPLHPTYLPPYLCLPKHNPSTPPMVPHASSWHSN